MQLTIQTNQKTLQLDTQTRSKALWQWQCWTLRPSPDTEGWVPPPFIKTQPAWLICKKQKHHTVFSIVRMWRLKMQGVVRNRNKANIPIINISGIIMKGCCITMLLLLCPGSHQVAESLTVMSFNLNNTHTRAHTHRHWIFSRILAKTWLKFPIKCWNKTHSQNHKQAYLCCYSQEAASSLQA